MFGWTKRSKKEIAYIEDFEDNNDNIQQETFSDDERKLIVRIDEDFQNAKAVRQADMDDTGFSVEDIWEDEYKIYKGGGLQWLTNFAYRTKRNRRIRPNSEDNFVFNTLQVQIANITANVPEISFSGIEKSDLEIADKLTFASRFNDERNEFQKTYKKWVYDFVGAGPTIGMVIWDNNWMGGKGPNRWIGDVRILRVDKWDIYFDPAITNLEENLQDCSYIIRKIRKKLRYIRSIWENGKYVNDTTNEDELINEGGDPEQTDLIEYWHRGFPMFVSEERAKELRDRGLMLEQEGDYYKAQDYYDSAKGILEGVHVAYYADGVLLEYRAYEYEDGLYPFVFTTKYFDEKSQWGFGEIRNIKIPQIMHNKADEIEIEAMAKEGLGGSYYQKGAVNSKQIDKILENSGKGGMWFEVDNVNLIKDRTGVKVPGSIVNYKDSKERIINAIQPATTIQQGISPGANVPFSTVRELGARTDVRMKQTADKLEDFLRKINELRVNRFVQFYTEERYYRIKGSDGNVKEGTIKADELMQDWTREVVYEDQVDPFTGQPIQVPVERKERFVPEFDIKITIMSEKPTDRNYYTNLAMQLYQMQLLTPEDLLYTLEDGKLPPIEDILKHVYAQNQIMGIVAQIQKMPPEIQQLAMQTMQQSVQDLIGKIQQMSIMQQQMQQQPQQFRQPIQQQNPMMG